MELALFGRTPTATGAFLNFGTGTSTLLIDSSRLEFGCPLDLAGILATAHWAADLNLAVTFKLPVDPNVASYMQRMDVLRQMPETTRFIGRLPADNRTDLRGRLMEATRLNAGNINDVSERLGYLLTEFYAPYSEAAGGAVFRACGELLDNAAEHGVSEAGAFVAAQTYTGLTTSSPRVELAVCDTGVGVLQHLRRNSAYAYLTSDQPALQRALERGVSGVGSDRGNGLSDVIGDTSKHGRIRFEMRSGRGQITVDGVNDAHKVKTSPRMDDTYGTWAWLTHMIPNRE